MNLFNIARRYTQFGYHRTGSESQLATEDWLLELIEPLADQIYTFEFDYLHFDTSCEVQLNGRIIPSLPLYYQAVGILNKCQNVETATVNVDFEEHGAFQTIQSLLKQANRNKADALIVATKSANNSLYALNVSPELKNTLPVILVPGKEWGNLNQKNLLLNFSASVEQRNANNIIATFGDVSTQPRIVVTTPISGWFECAGERATGVTLAIALAEQLSKNCAVELVLATGHELGYRGGFKYTASLDQTPAAVIHLGSCLATFGATLQAWSNFDAEVFDDLTQVLQPLGIPTNKVNTPGRRSDWVGEAECWAHMNCPIFSIAGDYPLFHTADDRIEAATDENELSGMFETLSQLAKIITATI